MISEIIHRFHKAGAKISVVSRLDCDCCSLKTVIVYFHYDGDAETVMADPRCSSINGSDLALHLMSDHNLLNASFLDTPADADDDDLPVVRQTEGYRSCRQRSCKCARP